MTKKSNPTIPASLLSDLQALSDPAWLIDVPRSRIVWTNASGRKLLERDTLSGSAKTNDGQLDRAMPALERLREIHFDATQTNSPSPDLSAGEKKASTPHSLVFWTPHGVVRQLCNVKFMAGPASDLALVTSVNSGTAKLGSAALSLSDSVKPQSDSLYGGLQRDRGLQRQQQSENLINNTTQDAIDKERDTLQEIARRIREKPNGRSSPFSLDALHSTTSESNDTRSSIPSNATDCNMNEPILKNFVKAALGQESHFTRGRKSNALPHPIAQPASLPALTSDSSVSAPGPVREPVARLAHELRTPISAIHTAAEILAQEQFGPIGSSRYIGYAEDIRQSAAHALSVIEAMLDPDYLASGKHPIKMARLDPCEVITSAVSGILPITDSKGINLSTEFEPGFPHLMADKRTVQQILLNLLTNAVKFTPSGGAILVTARRGARGTALIEVNDSGPGMSDSEIKTAMLRIRAEQSVNIQSGDATRTGRGFGLPLVMSLARTNGADFNLSQADAGGLTASIIFPRSRQLPV